MSSIFRNGDARINIARPFTLSGSTANVAQTLQFIHVRVHHEIPGGYCDSEDDWTDWRGSHWESTRAAGSAARLRRGRQQFPRTGDTNESRKRTRAAGARRHLTAGRPK